MAREKIIGSGAVPGEEERKRRDVALRPRLLSEVIGQRRVAERLQIAVNAAKKLKEPLGHILFDGPPGLGKTTFATVLPNELGTSVQMTSGPALAKPADLLPFLTNLEEGSILVAQLILAFPEALWGFAYTRGNVPANLLMPDAHILEHWVERGQPPPFDPLMDVTGLRDYVRSRAGQMAEMEEGVEILL